MRTFNLVQSQTAPQHYPHYSVPFHNFTFIESCLMISDLNSSYLILSHLISSRLIPSHFFSSRFILLLSCLNSSHHIVLGCDEEEKY